MLDLGQSIAAGGPGTFTAIVLSRNQRTAYGSPAPEFLTSVVHKDGSVIGVGGGSALITSDGPIKSPEALHLNGIAADGSVAIAVGRFGTILASTNGIDWMAVPSRLTNHLNSITHGNGRFVVVGNAGAILSSTNALDWQLGPIDSRSDLNAVMFGGGEFVAVIAQKNFATSLDGLTWSIGTATNWSSIQDISYGNGFFVGAGFSPVVTPPTVRIGLELYPAVSMALLPPQPLATESMCCLEKALTHRLRHF